jgi:type IV secretory pathway VirJ component
MHLFPSAIQPERARVLLLSGDGGVGAVERTLTRHLVRLGFDVVMIDCRRAFATRRSRSWIAGYLAALHPRSAGRPLVLIGYSFGADLIPLVWSRLDEALRARVALIALVSPTHDGSTVVDVTGRYDPALMTMTRLSASAASLPMARVLCVSGAAEVNSGYSSCHDAPLAQARVVDVAGGHDLGGEAGVVAELVATALDEQCKDRRRALQTNMGPSGLAPCFGLTSPPHPRE